MPDALAPDPERGAEEREVLALLAPAIEEELTEHQRRGRHRG